MCDVRPFCGLRYDLQRAGAPSTIITPPYDVISPEERARFYRANPHNVIRIEYGAEEPGDTPESNKYTRAAATLDQWLREDILVRDRRPAFYVVEHSFSYRDAGRSRWGLIARVRLEDFESGRVHPHERTNRAPAVDRLNLLRACRANISPVMGLFRTESGEMAARLRDLSRADPAFCAEDGQGVIYRLWVLDDEAEIAEVSGFFDDRDIYIADGHHRYETALRYRNERRAAASSLDDDEPFNFVMMSLMDSQDPGLVMQPTHRTVKGLEPARVAELESKISPYFEAGPPITPMTAEADTVEHWLRTLELRGREGTVLGLYGGHGQDLRLLILRPDADLRGLLSAEELRLWKGLDVVLLQRIVIQEALGIWSLDDETAHLDYTRDALLAKQRVDSGERQLAFFLNPAPITSILESAEAGRRLPQKSTYFHPKTPAGLVMYPLWDQS
jgi:uncharacterized protein (DUF1015 family)